VLSGFAGLKSFSLAFSNTFDPDMKAVPASGKFYSLSPEEMVKINALTGVRTLSRELEERVYLTHQQKSHVAYIKGVDSLYRKSTGIDSTLYLGEWNVDGQFSVAGIGVANLLGLTINNYRSPLVVLAPKPGKVAFNPQSLREKPYNEQTLVLSGIYSIEENLDRKYVFAGLPLVQGLLEKDSQQVSGLNIRLEPDTDHERVRTEIAEILGNKVLIKNRQELNSTLYRMLNTENLATYLIFTLVLIIALFNVVGAIIMMILDKLQNSKTLYSLGSTLNELRRIYFIQGVLVTSIGGLAGVLLGSILIGSQLAFGWLKITPSLAYPVEFQPVNILIVLATIVFLGLVASKIASSRVTLKLIAQ
jgi:lipoprotein-releasing system permease protein